MAACAHAPTSPDFTLTDDSGHSWTLSAQRGRTVLLYFGFTHCADECPLTMRKLARVAQAADPSGRSVVVAMVSVDPQRDTPEVLHAFVSRIDPSGRVVGLTGSPQSVATVENAYHTWAQRRRSDVAHSTGIYYIDASGVQRSLHDDADPQADLAAALREIL